MKIKDYKCKCGHNDFFFANKGNQKGIYCTNCGKWFKWADKDEQNLQNNEGDVAINNNAELKHKICEDMIHDSRIGRRSLEAILEILDKHLG